jgi:hypothetical protein
VIDIRFRNTFPFVEGRFRPSKGMIAGGNRGREQYKSRTVGVVHPPVRRVQATNQISTLKYDMVRSSSNQTYIQVTVQESVTGSYLSERAFLHGIIASLLLAHNSLLWYFPSGKSRSSSLHHIHRSLTTIP